MAVQDPSEARSYIKVRWNHDSSDEPRVLYSELDQERWERRKIEIFPDGRWGYADDREEVGGSFLGEAPVPPLDKLNADPAFEAVEIQAHEFEGIWCSRHGREIMGPFPRPKTTHELFVEAEELWRNGDALRAGRLLYERLSADQRPGWAARVLEVCCQSTRRVPAEVDAVRQIARTRSRWNEGHDAFSAVRSLTLRSEIETRRPGDVAAGILYLAENVAKVTYNASGLPAPFDQDAGWWVAKTARSIVAGGGDDVVFTDRVWQALTGWPEGSLPRINSSELALLWMHDYYDGPLSGALLFHRRIRWFEYCGDGDEGRRRYLVLDLTDAEVEDERRWHDLFVEHVGDHWTIRPDGTRGTVKPASEHAKFYEPYGQRRPVDYTHNPVLGWFEL
jgi:hypothetical protein